MKGTGYDFAKKSLVAKPGSGLSQREIIRAAEKESGGKTTVEVNKAMGR
jgi:hypothetical protein